MPDIFDTLAHDWREIRRHHTAPTPADGMPVIISAATAARPQETTMSAITDIKNEIAAAAHDIAAKAAEFEQTILPAAAARLTALEGNPVVDSLLKAAHVPPEALDIVVKTIDGLEALYTPVAASPAAPAQQ